MVSMPVLGADFFGNFSAFLSLLPTTLVIPARLGKSQFSRFALRALRICVSPVGFC
jgi:hypothetical protein